MGKVFTPYHNKLTADAVRVTHTNLYEVCGKEGRQAATISN